MLPAELAAETLAGGKIPITYLPGKPEYAFYGVSKTHLFVADAVTVCLILAAIATAALWSARSRNKLIEFRRANGGRPFAIAAVAFGVVAAPCFYMTMHLLRWELGMDYAKRTSPSEITELFIRDGSYVAKYAFAVENGRRGWRWRQFDVSEIDDVEKMKVGRKFDVVYIDGMPLYNRPDWVEAIHASVRKWRILLWSTAAEGCVGVALLAVYWARGGPKSPSPRLSPVNNAFARGVSTP